MVGSSFNETRFKKTTITDSHLEECEFFHTSLKNMDFTTNQITGIKTTMDALQGLKINEFQALELIHLLGVIVI